MRTTLKNTVAAIGSGNYDQATAAYQQAVPALDRAVSHGLIHRNKAARHKSRLNNQIRALKGA